jgi:hypothetical protein
MTPSSLPPSLLQARLRFSFDATRVPVFRAPPASLPSAASPAAPARLDKPSAGPSSPSPPRPAGPPATPPRPVMSRAALGGACAAALLAPVSGVGGDPLVTACDASAGVSCHALALSSGLPAAELQAMHAHIHAHSLGAEPSAAKAGGGPALQPQLAQMSGPSAPGAFARAGSEGGDAEEERGSEREARAASALRRLAREEVAAAARLDR